MDSPVSQPGGGTPSSGGLTWLWWVLGLLVLASLVWIVIGQDRAVTPSEESVTESSPSSETMDADQVRTDSAAVPVTEEMATQMETLVYTHLATLADVTITEGVTTVSTNGTATGTAQAVYADGAYSLLATFAGLPDPADGYFYEGWIVRPASSPAGMSVLSSGKVEQSAGVYTNRYRSTTDLLDHTRYVLTIEPDDGNPAPAEHVLDGNFNLR